MSQKWGQVHDHTSRFAREIGDLLQKMKLLQFYGVRIVVVGQGLDSSQPNWKQALLLHGFADEQYIDNLRYQVRRGQEGRMLKGLIPGGKCYGYRNVPIEDPTRSAKYGRPAILGVRRVILENEAQIILGVFQRYANGMGQGAIAIELNRQGVEGPNGPWSRYTIHEMLGNEKYHGVHIWGQTKKNWNPETARKVSRPTPESEWRRLVVEEWRIIPEKLWQEVQARRKEARESFHKLGGLTRTERARTYLFSGDLICGNCRGSIVICAGGGKRGWAKYGCHAHKHNGMCDNRLLIRQDRLEDQLLAAIQQRILSPAVIEDVVKKCEAEFRRRLTEMNRIGSIITAESLKKDLEDRKQRLARVMEALEIRGDVRSLTTRVCHLEGEINRIEAAIHSHRPVPVDVRAADIRDHVTKSLRGLRELLACRGEAEVARAKKAIAGHIGKLTLTPVIRDGRPVYKVTGTVTVQDEKCRMQLVARDGIEPPTPAFSELRSAGKRPVRIRLDRERRVSSGERSPPARSGVPDFAVSPEPNP